MGSLLDELREKPPTPCMVCQWLSTRPTDEQADWREAIASSPKAIPTARLVRVAQKHKATFKLEPMRRHRLEQHGAG